MFHQTLFNALYTIVLILYLFLAETFAADLSAISILDSMISVMQPNGAKGLMEQEIITSSNIQRIFEFEYFSSNKGENVLIRYLKPKKMKNNAFIVKNNGDNIWVYFPKTRRVRKLANHAKNQKAHGSDFSYEDFSGSEGWKKKYFIKQEFSGERENYLLVLLPRPAVETGYDTLRIFVNKLSYYPDRIQYFMDGGHFKTLRFKDVKVVQGIPTPMIMQMENHTDNSRTTIKILEMSYKMEYEEGFFTERNLGR